MPEIKWRKVSSSTRWNPRDKGDELIGIYKGSRVGDGAYGVYTAHFVLTEHGMKTLTGCVIDQLFASIPEHTDKSVKVVFMGRKEFNGADGDTREMKLFELFVEE
jgi:hypothetical protein